MQLVEQDYFYERKELEEYVQHVGIHPDTRENVSESDIRGVQVPEHPPGLLEIESDFLWEHPVYYPSYQKVRQFSTVMGSVRSRTLPINTLICVTKATQETRSKLQDELKIDDALEEQLRAVKTQIALKAQDLEEALNKTGRLCDHLRRRHLTITYENENYHDL